MGTPLWSLKEGTPPLLSTVMVRCKNCRGKQCPLFDILRDTPVRLLGYANEVGESFRPVVPRLVLPSYGVSSLYVLVDTYDKASRSWKKHAAESNRKMRTCAVAADTLVWQAMASVIIPGFTINRIVAFSRGIFDSVGSRWPVGIRRWAPVALGLGAIPLIVEPIDSLVHRAMDWGMRPHLGIPTHYPTAIQLEAEQAKQSFLHGHDPPLYDEDTEDGGDGDGDEDDRA